MACGGNVGSRRLHWTESRSTQLQNISAPAGLLEATSFYCRLNQKHYCLILWHKCQDSSFLKAHAKSVSALYYLLRHRSPSFLCKHCVKWKQHTLCRTPVNVFLTTLITNCSKSDVIILRLRFTIREFEKGDVGTSFNILLRYMATTLRRKPKFF